MESGFNHENGLAVLSKEGPDDALHGFHSLPRHHVHFSGKLVGLQGCRFSVSVVPGDSGRGINIQ